MKEEMKGSTITETFSMDEFLALQGCVASYRKSLSAISEAEVSAQKLKDIKRTDEVLEVIEKRFMNHIGEMILQVLSNFSEE